MGAGAGFFTPFASGLLETSRAHPQHGRRGWFLHTVRVRLTRNQQRPMSALPDARLLRSPATATRLSLFRQLAARP